MGKKELLKVCDYCCEWRTSHLELGPERICEDYPEMMRHVLRKWFGMPKKAAKLFVDTACMGNWERMHETHVERLLRAEDYASYLLDEVFYCSDRWSYDRVIRVNWLYQRLRDRISSI